MNVGGSIALTLVGAALAFAVRGGVPGLDVFVLGVILMVGGIVWLILSLTIRAGRYRTDVLSTTETTETRHTPDGEVVVRRVDREVLPDDEVW